MLVLLGLDLVGLTVDVRLVQDARPEVHGLLGLLALVRHALHDRLGPLLLAALLRQGVQGAAGSAQAAHDQL
eukprot:7732815-Alexandrium_andersonii.AAC.1